ncbi:hypothetical protein [Thermococcus pacificus]|uniref:Uncharacterized protein n=1 Tax=Thermococcus pacificus TaxID=71998 RepID=A0A218P7Q8_9EURY|nr:hypothetical protein [Thermococcus pacificus]ASJ06802.1 hypothetical protein A3L08_05450 [Thermococcus pacificus]
METHEVELGQTLRSKKLLALLLISVLLTYAVPFPFIAGFLEDYGKIKEIKKQMEEENEAIVCHTVYDTDPEFFGSQGMECSDENYRPNESTVSCCGMSVYRDTYQEYLRAREDLGKELPKFVLFVVWVFLSLLAFSYALVEGAVSITNGGEVSLKRSILSGFRALPALVASEFVMFVAIIAVLILLAVPMAILGPLGGILVVILTAPAFALVIPVYYFERKIGPVGEIWRIFKNNTGGYLVLGLLAGIVDLLVAFQYEYYFGIGTLLIMLAIGIPRYVLNSVGALVVYLDGVETLEREEKRGIEWEV